MPAPRPQWPGPGGRAPAAEPDGGGRPWVGDAQDEKGRRGRGQRQETRGCSERSRGEGARQPVGRERAGHRRQKNIRNEEVLLTLHPKVL